MPRSPYDRHCGGIVDPSVLDEFRGRPARVVLATTNKSVMRSKTGKELGFGAIGETLELIEAAKSILVYHGTKSTTLRRYIDGQAFDYVLHGHTHQVRDERVGKTRVITPGALYRTTKYTVATLDPIKDELTFLTIPR